MATVACRGRKSGRSRFLEVVWSGLIASFQVETACIADYGSCW
jgi:hypothetical protein